MVSVSEQRSAHVRSRPAPDHTPAQHGAAGLRRRLVGRWDEWQLRIGSCRTSHGDDYVANGAQACSLAAEQEEGPFYVALDQIREDVVGGQTGVPLQLEITVINSLACSRSSTPRSTSGTATRPESTPTSVQRTPSARPICAARSSPTSTGGSRSTPSFPATTPGARLTYTPSKVHISAQRSNGKLAGGHVAHTGQLFPWQAVYTEVYKLSPYKTETAPIVTHAQDRVWNQQHGSEGLLTIKNVGHRLTKGLVATVTLAVNPKATPALIGPASPSG